MRRHYLCGFSYGICSGTSYRNEPPACHQASIPIQTSHNPTRSAKAADPEPFDGNQDQTKEFVRAVWIAVTMQADTFADERMKILYALSFMCGGTAQVWAGE